jgi:TonB-linked SusC/RagA family outer membrane protein
MKGIRSYLVLAALLALPGLAAAQQGATITGVVRTDAGAPLPAVSVVLEGTNIGAQTRDDGTYSISVPATSVNGQSAQLIARRIGYRQGTATITLSSGTIRQDFTLTSTATQLSEVVVTALGVQTVRSRLGTAVQQVSAEALNETRAQNVMQQIQGKVSGVQITAGGTLGGSTNIIIRGQNSISGNNQPLFIVDGVAVSNANRGGAPFVGAGTSYDYGNAMSDLNSDDIESLTVLKGPNAAAIYGSRAANGVVLIQTRRGRNTGGRVLTEINTNLTFEDFSVFPKFQNLYGQGSGGQFEWYDGNYGGNNDGVDESWGPRLDGRLICQFTSPGAGTDNCQPTPWVAHPDNVKSFFQTGVTASTTVGVSGGTDRAYGRLSLGADNIRGIFPENLFQRRTATLSGTFLASGRASMDGSVQYIRNSGRNRPGVGYSGVNPLQSMFNWFGRQVDMAALRDYSKGGAANGGPANAEFNWNYSYHNNPFWQMAESPTVDDRDRVIGSVALNYRLAEGLNAQLRTGSDIYRFGVKQLYGERAQSFVDWTYAGGFRFLNDYRNDNNTDLTLTGTRLLTNWLEVNAVAGGNLRREYFSSNFQQTPGIVVPGIYNPSNAAIAPSIGETTQRRQVRGIYGSAAFTVNRWWSVEGTARNDWSSTLPEGANSYFYPSVNTSVVLTDAVPSLQSRFLSSLKLRAAAARVGSDAPVYALSPVFLGSSNKFGSQPQFSLDPTLANANLKPEITRSDEVGAEMGLFDNRVTLDASYYSKSTRNQIFDVEVSPASGFNRKWINAGEITNKGLEALVGVTLLRNPTGFNWNTTFSYARNRSMVEELAEDVDAILLQSGGFGEVRVEARVGEPYGVIRGFKFQRDSATGKLLTSGTTGLPLREAALSTLGTIQPNWTGGWANQFSFGRFTLNSLLDIKRGGKLYSVTQMFGEYAGVLESSLRGREDDFDSPGIVVDGINATTRQPNTIRVTSERYFHGLFGRTENYVYDASYVKLRELRLAYDMPESWASRILGARAASIALTGRNLKMWTRVPNIDPEFAYSSSNAQGIEVNMSPNPRSIGINLRIVP